MTTYIYFVKCPGCEDEHFDFFNEAKEFALGCLSQKPVITQTEVERNDFGECTDSTDLGTIWSWEEIMKDTATDDEPAKCIFTKDDLKQYIDDKDPEFDNIDNSVDFNDVEDAVNFLVKDEEEAIAGYEKVEAVIDALGVENTKEVLDTLDHIKAEEEEHIEELKALLDDTSEEPVDTYKRKPIPEGMTIDQLKEAMEENEDTVECAGCEELFPKEACFHKEGIGYLCGDCEDRIVKCIWCEDLYDKYECDFEADMGWLCDRCQSAITSRGERLTIITNPTDEDFARVVTEEVEQSVDNTLTFEDLVKDSINHLVNDLGKDPWTDDFADDVIRDLENNYISAPEDMIAYNNWCSEVASEVSRQVNRDYKLEEEISEVHDLGNEYDGGYPTEKPNLPEEDEMPEISDSHLRLCPECGKEAFDAETGICVNCGFN